MHQESPNGKNFVPNQLPHHQSTTNRYGYNHVNIQHTSTSRPSIPNRPGNTYGNIGQTATSIINPVKSPFSVVKNITQTTTSPLIPSLNTIQHFATPNKKISSLPNIVKPPQTMQITKVKLEAKEEVEEDPSLLRERILQLYFDSVEEIKGNFKEKLQELFFVQSGGNMVDYPAWKLRPNPHLLSFLNIYRLDDTTTLSTPTATNTVSPSIKMQAAYTPAGSGSTMQHVSTHIATPNIRYSNYPEINKIIPQTLTSTVGQYGFVQGAHTPHVDKKPNISSSIVSCIKQETINLHKDSPSGPSVCKQNDMSKITFSMPIQQLSQHQTPAPNSSQDEILGQVRHESEIVQRISRLRKNGLWSASRLPKVFEQHRKKSQWDFLLEEMQWLATDFSQEKKWKRNMAKKISRSVMKFHQDKSAYQKKVKKEEVARLKRVAGRIAKEVKQFWRQIEKVACYKQQSRQEEQRRKALDLHLNFIVGQTEKYSSWLAEGMKDASVTSSVSSRQVSDGDDDFDPDEQVEADDEETIAEEETIDKEDGKILQAKYREELDALKEESEIPMEDLLKTLPRDMLMRISGQGESKSVDNENKEDSDSEGCSSSSDSDISVGGMDKKEDESEEEYIVNEQEMKDDEETIEEEEALGEEDHKTEIDNLQSEAELPIEELLKLYGTSSNRLPNNSDSDSESAPESDSESDSPSEPEIEVPDINVETAETTKIAQSETSPDKSSEDKSVPNQQLTDAAATAESLQPKGFTLSTTQVKTQVPFLLHHTLREYQHIGLDWLVTMYQKQLNGILADEMGLGKTIQTIALLAHLACEEGIWGPHLIIVPTSVMLNWEFEFKKWCPGFKILTYFGTQKERKLKRSGWMKPNAFHVCITSYNLVIQDHQAFRRRKWKYLILDEAQNIKNFKSQRWQMLLNFHSQRRLLLTGTPLQNSLMELWSLMHFLMPNVFQSHQDFKEWFANPLTGMIEGSTEYNDGIIKRLHTVLRPFLLRRLKSEVELQMPKKYEHVIRCRLSKRQRFLYDEFMARTKTKETLEAGNFLSVINILMQLRKVCNHPDLFELRPTVSPYTMERLVYSTASLVNNVISYEPLEHFCLADYEQTMCAFQAHRTRQLKIRKSLMQNFYSSNDVDNSAVESAADSHSQDYGMSSSHFQPLCNVSEEMDDLSERELSRSYLDCITPWATTAGFATIGDVLTRQVEQSLENSEVDVINVVDVDDELYCPATKKPKVANVDNTPTKGHLLEDFIADDVSPFFLSDLKQKNEEQRSLRLCYCANMNERHSEASPVYGLDLHHAVKVVDKNSTKLVGALLHQYGKHRLTDVLSDIIKTPERRVLERKTISEKFLFYVYPVLSSPATMKTCHVQPSEEMKIKNLSDHLHSLLYRKFDFLSPMVNFSRLQFPETRLVQYDCGKLQTLDVLLRQLKAGKHRVLIFTQMTRMLDVLERFLNYHGFIYVRLDGSTKVDQRQILMERFNQDTKIFVFILSTRSGGIGVNLTGADTVIFYDSDWNPTMDAQAQDRCHRIGQTRDVHIYRLVSDKTVEENILKKAQKKRLLGNIAIEGGNFTAAYFKQNSVKELFNISDVNESTSCPKENTNVSKGKVSVDVNGELGDGTIKKNQYEEVLAKVEEEDDVKATERAKIEQDSELLEFSENAQVGDNPSNEVSSVEKALTTLESELKPIERFALKYIEVTNTFLVEDEVEETEKMLELKKKEWELDHLQSIKEAEEKKHAEDDDMLFTYARDDTYSKHFIDDYSGVLMPVWTPPTPPREGTVDMVTDPCLAFLYETPTIPENHLPPTHCYRKGGMDLYAMKRNTNRTHYLSIFKKKRHRLSRPKSIFDKKALEILNKNKLKKSQKLKQKAMAAPVVSSAVTVRPDSSQQGADWLISEDWTLLQAITSLSELPLDFQSEAVNNKLANWELAADVVNIASRMHRSSRQCRDRYQNVVLPREEGKLGTPLHSDTIDGKIKKNKKNIHQISLLKNSSVMQQKTHLQFNQDHGKGVINMHYAKFDSVKKTALKRKPTVKQPNSNKILGSSRHTQILAANGIASDKPLNPRELATMRAERIAKEKAQAVVAAQQLQQHQTSTTTSTTSTTSAQVQVSLALTSRVTLAQPANISVAGVGSIQKGVTAGILQTPNRGNLVFTSAGTVSNNGSSSLVVNPSSITSTPAGLTTTAASFAAINRKMQNVSQNAISLGQLPIVSATGATRILGNQTIGQSTQMLPGLVQSKLTSQSGNSFTVAVSSVSSVVVPNLVTQVQRGATIAGSVGNPAGLITAQPFIQGKALNQHHIALLRQKAQQQQQQQQLQKMQQQRIQQQKQQQQQQLKLLQQQQQQQQPQSQTSQSQQQTSQSQVQASIQVQPTLVATSNQLGSLTVQTMKAPVTLRGSVPQQIVTQPLTVAQQQQLVQQALKKQQYQQLQQQRGQLTSNSQIQQMLAGQKLTQHQLQQLQQQQQRQSQLQQQQQLKFQQQVTATIVTQPKTQLVMTQVKPGQSVQSLKTSGQQIQLQQIQQSGSIQTSLPQQILLRPTLTQGSGQAQFQGIPQQIQLRAMISQQSAQQMQRVNAGQQLQAMQAQVNLQTGTVVMQPQSASQSVSQQQLSTAQVHVVSSLAQQQQRNIQAAVQKQVQQQHQTQLKVTSVSTGTTKSAQVQLQFQQPSQQLRHQVLSATPAQLSQVKAFVSQAQLQASLSRSNSPVGTGISAQPSTPSSIVPQNMSSSQVTSIQLQAQQVSQQIRSQAQMVQVQLKTSTADGHQSQQQQTKQLQLKQQLQQLQSRAVKQQQQQQQQHQQQLQQQQLRQTLTAGTQPVISQRSETPKIPESPLAKPEVQGEVATLGAETELSIEGNQDKDSDDPNQGK